MAAAPREPRGGRLRHVIRLMSSLLPLWGESRCINDSGTRRVFLGGGMAAVKRKKKQTNSKTTADWLTEDGRRKLFRERQTKTKQRSSE